jgi:hypothetical protein
MAGMKYKLAHRRADKTTWSASDRAQRKRLVQILREMIAEIERQGGAEPRKQSRPQAARRRNAPVRRRAPPARRRRHAA